MVMTVNFPFDIGEWVYYAESNFPIFCIRKSTVFGYTVVKKNGTIEKYVDFKKANRIPLKNVSKEESVIREMVAEFNERYFAENPGFRMYSCPACGDTRNAWMWEGRGFECANCLAGFNNLSELTRYDYESVQ